MAKTAIDCLRIGMIVLTASGSLFLAGCETKGQTKGAAGEEKTFDVQTAEREEVLDALEKDGRVSLTGGVVFETDSATLSRHGQTRVAQLAAALEQNPTWKVTVIGYTDDTGGYDYNLKLSQDRAQSVVDALVLGHGIARNRLAAEGRGPNAPVASNETPEGRAQNRRVEVTLIK